MKGITVNEALELLKSQGVILKSGRKGLFKVIETVSVLEINVYQKWLHGGELFLTTLSQFNTNAEICKLIKELEKAGTAVLAVHPGSRSELKLDQDIYNLAEEINFPIFLLPVRIPYSTVFSVILGAILDKQKLLLEEAHKINNYLTDILLTGGSFKKIVQFVQAILNQPVLIADSNEGILEAAGTAKYPLETIIGEADKIIGDLYQGAGEAGRTGANMRKLPGMLGNQRISIYIKDIEIAGEHYGNLVTFTEDGQEQSEMLDIVLTQAVTAVALEKMKCKEIMAAEQKLNKDFLEDLLNEHYDSEEAIIRRARNLGLELKGKHNVMIIDIDRFENYYLKYFQKGEAHFQNLKNRLYRIIEFSVLARSQKSIILPKSDSYIIFPHFSVERKEEEIKNRNIELAQEIQGEVCRMFEEITVSVGIGGYSELLTGLAVSYRQAQQALKIGCKISGGNGIFDYAGLGVYSLLYSCDSKEFKESCRTKLVQLLEYDRTYNAELVKTMEVYLDCNESISLAAQRLFIHPNTVKYRLHRIKEILHKDPFGDGEEKLYYHIALKTIKVCGRD
ncbi:MAG: PucR family transcriptional regulator [Peptococcaceae bacterium]